MSWIDCKVDSDYEIYTEFPYQIRRKFNKKIIKEGVDKDYIRCRLNQKLYYKHVIIALQFIPNDDPINKTQVDHINRVKTDNILSNLRWVSPSENNKNRSPYAHQKIIYVKELPKDWVPFELYNGFEFERYSYSPSEDKFYYDNGVKIRVQNLTDHTGYKIFMARDITGIYRKIYVNRWKRDNGYE